MTLLAVIVPIAILGALVMAAVLFFQRGAGGLDASPRALLRLYLYLGSLVSILVLVAGLAQTITGVLGAIAPGFTYGEQPQAVPAIGAPPAPGQTPAPIIGRPTPQDQNDRRTRDSLLQGITSVVAGALFWAVHWYGRRTLETSEERAGVLRRSYQLLGTAIFGVASIVLVPIAVYSTLRWFLLPVGQFEFRQGAGESLAAAVAVVPFWILFLRIVLTGYRAAPSATEPPPATAALR